jgi:hypothetical protein
VITDLHVENRPGSNLASGLDLVYYIRDRLKSPIPLVVTTGLELISEPDIIKYGADLFFYKASLNPYDFMAKINELVRTKGQHSRQL